MRIAVQGCFANTPTAERELVQRLVRGVHNLGWQAACVLTSAEIVAFRPDCVLATHFTSPKLTEFPTLGLMANPPQYFNVFANSVENVLTYDGYLTSSARITQYLTDLLFSTGKQVPISELPFHLSCPRTELVARPPGPRRLFYVGMRWDRGRHGTLFARLARTVPLDAYGPAERWADLPDVYRGFIPFDGTSVVTRIREAGAALCIHSPEHRAWGIPTMRIWEAAAAGAVIITDVADFARQHFGDALLYIDLEKSEEDVLAQIAEHMDWINRHPEQAGERARQAHAIFSKSFCLEEQLRRLPAFVDRVRRAAGYAVSTFASYSPLPRYSGGEGPPSPQPLSPEERGAPDASPRPRYSGGEGPGVRGSSAARPAPSPQPLSPDYRGEGLIGQTLRDATAAGPLVEYLVRAGPRPARFLDRCLASLREQSYRPLGVIVVPVGSPDGLAGVLARYQEDFASFRVLPAEPVGVASHALWAGLRALTAPYFGVLDDDDRLHPNHVASVMEVLRARPEVGLAHSGGVRVQEEAGFAEDEPHLRGPSGTPIGEDRRLVCFAAVDREVLLRGDRCLLGNSWIARRELLTERVLEDPDLPVLEDLYLHALLASRAETAFTWRPTAEWNWRSATGDNLSFREDLVAECRERVRLRLRFWPGLAELQREEERDRAVERELRSLRQELQAFNWVGSAEMLALRRGTQSLLVLRGMRRSLRDWRLLRRRVWRGLRTVRQRGVGGFLRRMVSLGRE